MSMLKGGKLKLVQAALRLTTHSRSLAGLGLRELAREAELNPNTFYRHFRNLDDFGLFVLDYLAREMKQAVRDMRQAASTTDQATHESVNYVYQYFLANPAATTVAVRELHGASPVLRRALQQQLDSSASEMTEDLVERNLVPGLNRATIDEISHMTIRYILFRGMDYIEQPENRERIRTETERFITRQFRGALAEVFENEVAAGQAG